MLLTEITRIIRTLLVTLETVGPQDPASRRRIGQIAEIVGAVDDVAADEAEQNVSLAAKRVGEAHDIIHRVARILEMEEDPEGAEDGPLDEVDWDGELEGENIDTRDDGAADGQ